MCLLYQNVKGYLLKGKIKKTKAWSCYHSCHSWLAIHCSLHWKITDAPWLGYFFLFLFRKYAVFISNFKLDFRCYYSPQVSFFLLSCFLSWEEQRLETGLVGSGSCKYLCSVNLQRLFHKHIVQNVLLTFIQFPRNSIPGSKKIERVLSPLLQGQVLASASVFLTLALSARPKETFTPWGEMCPEIHNRMSQQCGTDCSELKFLSSWLQCFELSRLKGGSFPMMVYGFRKTPGWYFSCSVWLMLSCLTADTSGQFRTEICEPRGGSGGCHQCI